MSELFDADTLVPCTGSTSDYMSVHTWMKFNVVKLLMSWKTSSKVGKSGYSNSHDTETGEKLTYISVMLCINRIESVKLKGINNSTVKGEEVLKPLKLNHMFLYFQHNNSHNRRTRNFPKYLQGTG